MTIQEAIKSGKPFKRKAYAHWSWIVVRTDGGADDAGELRFRVLATGHSAELWPVAILADDWELKEDETDEPVFPAK